eukprot:GHVL01000322.1.p1 GENE.GHVL01000322.1~~GHVL01000322.1.p1  ORF type:complete len:2347 (+),score=612.38 GHVL01000322.1:63-7103(+)
MTTEELRALIVEPCALRFTQVELRKPQEASVNIRNNLGTTVEVAVKCPQSGRYKINPSNFTISPKQTQSVIIQVILTRPIIHTNKKTLLKDIIVLKSDFFDQKLLVYIEPAVCALSGRTPSLSPNNSQNQRSKERDKTPPLRGGRLRSLAADVKRKQWQSELGDINDGLSKTAPPTPISINQKRPFSQGPSPNRPSPDRPSPDRPTPSTEVLQLRLELSAQQQSLVESEHRANRAINRCAQLEKFETAIINENSSAKFYIEEKIRGEREIFESQGRKILAILGLKDETIKQLEQEIIALEKKNVSMQESCLAAQDNSTALEKEQRSLCDALDNVATVLNLSDEKQKRPDEAITLLSNRIKYLSDDNERLYNERLRMIEDEKQLQQELGRRSEQLDATLQQLECMELDHNKQVEELNAHLNDAQASYQDMKIENQLQRNTIQDLQVISSPERSNVGIQADLLPDLTLEWPIENIIPPPYSERKNEATSSYSNISEPRRVPLMKRSGNRSSDKTPPPKIIQSGEVDDYRLKAEKLQKMAKDLQDRVRHLEINKKRIESEEEKCYEIINQKITDEANKCLSEKLTDLIQAHESKIKLLTETKEENKKMTKASETDKIQTTEQTVQTISDDRWESTSLSVNDEGWEKLTSEWSYRLSKSEKAKADALHRLEDERRQFHIETVEFTNKLTDASALLEKEKMKSHQNDNLKKIEHLRDENQNIKKLLQDSKSEIEALRGQRHSDYLKFSVSKTELEEKVRENETSLIERHKQFVTVLKSLDIIKNSVKNNIGGGSEDKIVSLVVRDIKAAVAGLNNENQNEKKSNKDVIELVNRICELSGDVVAAQQLESSMSKRNMHLSQKLTISVTKAELAEGNSKRLTEENRALDSECKSTSARIREMESKIWTLEDTIAKISNDDLQERNRQLTIQNLKIQENNESLREQMVINRNKAQERLNAERSHNQSCVSLISKNSETAIESQFEFEISELIKISKKLLDKTDTIELSDSEDEKPLLDSKLEFFNKLADLNQQLALDNIFMKKEISVNRIQMEILNQKQKNSEKHETAVTAELEKRFMEVMTLNRQMGRLTAWIDVQMKRHEEPLLKRLNELKNSQEECLSTMGGLEGRLTNALEHIKEEEIKRFDIKKKMIRLEAEKNEIEVVAQGNAENNVLARLAGWKEALISSILNYDSSETDDKLLECQYRMMSSDITVKQLQEELSDMGKRLDSKNQHLAVIQSVLNSYEHFSVSNEGSCLQIGNMSRLTREREDAQCRANEMQIRIADLNNEHIKIIKQKDEDILCKCSKSESLERQLQLLNDDYSRREDDHLKEMSDLKYRIKLLTNETVTKKEASKIRNDIIIEKEKREKELKEIKKNNMKEVSRLQNEIISEKAVTRGLNRMVKTFNYLKNNETRDNRRVAQATKSETAAYDDQSSCDDFVIELTTRLAAYESAEVWQKEPSGDEEGENRCSEEERMLSLDESIRRLSNYLTETPIKDESNDSLEETLPGLAGIRKSRQNWVNRQIGLIRAQRQIILHLSEKRSNKPKNNPTASLNEIALELIERITVLIAEITSARIQKINPKILLDDAVKRLVAVMDVVGYEITSASPEFITDETETLMSVTEITGKLPPTNQRKHLDQREKLVGGCKILLEKYKDSQNRVCQLQYELSNKDENCQTYPTMSNICTQTNVEYIDRVTQTEYPPQGESPSKTSPPPATSKESLQTASEDEYIEDESMANLTNVREEIRSQQDCHEVNRLRNEKTKLSQELTESEKERGRLTEQILVLQLEVDSIRDESGEVGSENRLSMVLSELEEEKKRRMKIESDYKRSEDRMVQSTQLLKNMEAKLTEIYKLYNTERNRQTTVLYNLKESLNIYNLLDESAERENESDDLIKIADMIRRQMIQAHEELSELSKIPDRRDFAIQATTTIKHNYMQTDEPVAEKAIRSESVNRSESLTSRRRLTSATSKQLPSRAASEKSKVDELEEQLNQSKLSSKAEIKRLSASLQIAKHKAEKILPETETKLRETETKLQISLETVKNCQREVESKQRLILAFAEKKNDAHEGSEKKNVTEKNSDKIEELQNKIKRISLEKERQQNYVKTLKEQIENFRTNVKSSSDVADGLQTRLSRSKLDNERKDHQIEASKRLVVELQSRLLEGNKETDVLRSQISKLKAGAVIPEKQGSQTNQTTDQIRDRMLLPLIQKIVAMIYDVWDAASSNAPAAAQKSKNTEDDEWMSALEESKRLLNMSDAEMHALLGDDDSVISTSYRRPTALADWLPAKNRDLTHLHTTEDATLEKDLHGATSSVDDMLTILTKSVFGVLAVSAANPTAATKVITTTRIFPVNLWVVQ